MWGLGSLLLGIWLAWGLRVIYPGWHSLTELQLVFASPSASRQAAAGHSVIVESMLFARSILRCSCCCQDFIKLLSALPSLSSLGHVTLSSSVWACHSCVQNPASHQILCNKEPATQPSLIGVWAVACSMPDIPLDLRIDKWTFFPISPNMLCAFLYLCTFSIHTFSTLRFSTLL